MIKINQVRHKYYKIQESIQMTKFNIKLFTHQNNHLKYNLINSKMKIMSINFILTIKKIQQNNQITNNN